MVKKQKRRATKYPALNPELNLKTRYEEIEDLASYAGKLSDADKDWLNRFSQEYICANFNHSGERIHPVIEGQYEDKKGNVLNSKDVYKTLSEHKNNWRNNDIHTTEKAQGCLNNIDDFDFDNERKARSEDRYD